MNSPQSVEFKLISLNFTTETAELLYRAALAGTPSHYQKFLLLRFIFGQVNIKLNYFRKALI